MRQQASQHYISLATGDLGIDLPTTKLDGVAWFVQISDLHLSRYDHLPNRQKLYGDKLGDLRCHMFRPFIGLNGFCRNPYEAPPRNDWHGQLGKGLTLSGFPEHH